MGSEHFASFLDRLDDCVAEFLVLKMRAHSIDKSLPELFAAFFINRFISHHRKLMRARSHENKHRIAFARFVNTEPMKFPLRRDKWIDA